jgi:hypothetical protein
LTEIPDTPDADSQRSLHTQREREQTCTARQGIACTRSFCMGLTSAEDLKQECFKGTENDILMKI